MKKYKTVFPKNDLFFGNEIKIDLTKKIIFFDFLQKTAKTGILSELITFLTFRIFLASINQNSQNIRNEKVRKLEN